MELVFPVFKKYVQILDLLAMQTVLGIQHIHHNQAVGQNLQIVFTQIVMIVMVLSVIAQVLVLPLLLPPQAVAPFAMEDGLLVRYLILSTLPVNVNVVILVELIVFNRFVSLQALHQEAPHQAVHLLQVLQAHPLVQAVPLQVAAQVEFAQVDVQIDPSPLVLPILKAELI